MDILAPDYTFADALLTALARALHLVPPDDAAGLSRLVQEVAPEPKPTPDAPAVVIPFGCTRWGAPGRPPRIVPYMYVQGQKISLGHYPYTEEGAALAARVRAAAVAEKERGGNIESVKRVAKETREDRPTPECPTTSQEAPGGTEG